MEGMKMGEFVIEFLGERGRRLGRLQLNPSTHIKTPGFLIHTVAGSVPHLTSEVLGMLFKPGAHPLQISIDTTYKFHLNVKPCGKTIGQFVGLHKYPSFLTVQNPLWEILPGYNNNTGISVWSKQGRKTLSVSNFIQIITSLQPTFFQVMSDYDVGSSTSVKRTKKSISRSMGYLEEVIEALYSEQAVPLATIEAGWFDICPSEADLTITQLMEKQNRIAGFVISGLEEKTENLYSRASRITQKLQSESDRIRYVPGSFTFLEIMDCIRSGIDLFDSSFVTRATENGLAFSLQLNDFMKKELLFVENCHELSLPPPHEKNKKNEAYAKDNHPALIDLKEKRYFDDFFPIGTNCICYSCRKFTRAYLHHLLSTSELLGPLLLMMHNLKQFESFFDVIRDIGFDEKRFNDLYEYLGGTEWKVPSANSSTEEIKNRKIQDDEYDMREIGNPTKVSL